MRTPSEREFVVCKITKVNPNSVFVEMVEYSAEKKAEGMIHISEVAKGWVKDIRKHVKPGQVVVAKVISKKGGKFGLSIKRVDPTQEKIKLKEYKLGLKAEKMLEIAAKDANLLKEKEKIREKLVEEFGSLYEAFKMVIKNPDIVKKKGVKSEWIDSLRKIAEKTMGQKEFTLKANLLIKSYKPGGINIIRSAIEKMERNNISVKYISAPKYIASMKTKNIKKDKKIFEELIEKALKNPDIKGEYELA